MIKTFKFATITITAVLLAAPVFGQAFQRLTSEQLQQSLFGVRLTGEVARSGIAWSECITPDGHTVFRSEGETQPGRLKISKRGQACFSYANSKNCFDVYRSGERLVLSGAVEFHVDRVETGIRTCPGLDVATS